MPGYYVRLIGGGMFFLGMLVMAFNVWKTCRGPGVSASVDNQPVTVALGARQ